MSGMEQILDIQYSVFPLYSMSPSVVWQWPHLEVPSNSYLCLFPCAVLTPSCPAWLGSTLVCLWGALSIGDLARRLYRHAQSAQSLLPHGHGHALLLCSGLPAGCINLLVHIRVFSQGLQQVLSQGTNALVTGHLL